MYMYTYNIYIYKYIYIHTLDYNIGRIVLSTSILHSQIKKTNNNLPLPSQLRKRMKNNSRNRLNFEKNHWSEA